MRSIMGEKKASALVKDASFVDEYRGKQIPGRQEVRNHPSDHRVGGEDADIRGDRERRRPGDEESWARNMGAELQNTVKQEGLVVK